MPEALLDANVVFAFRSARDQYHEPAREIIEAMDRGDLPRGQVTNYTLPEILNPIAKRAGGDAAVETLDVLLESAGLRLRHLAQEDFSRGQAVFRRHDDIEITDAILVSYMRRTGTDVIYSFDDDFDRFEELTRLASAVDPFA